MWSHDHRDLVYQISVCRVFSIDIGITNVLHQKQPPRPQLVTKMPLKFLSSRSHIQTMHHLASCIRFMHPLHARIKNASKSVHFQNIPSHILQSLNLLPRIHLLISRLLGVGCDGLLKHIGHIWHRPCRSAQVESSLLFDVGLDYIANSMPHTILDIDLLGLVS